MAEMDGGEELVRLYKRLVERGEAVERCGNPNCRHCGNKPVIAGAGRGADWAHQQFEMGKIEFPPGLQTQSEPRVFFSLADALAAVNEDILKNRQAEADARAEEEKKAGEPAAPYDPDTDEAHWLLETVLRGYGSVGVRAAAMSDLLDILQGLNEELAEEQGG